MYIAQRGLNFFTRFSFYFYVPQVFSAVVFKKPETERILDNNYDEKDISEDGENDGADEIQEEDLPPAATPEFREVSPVELQDGSTKVELQEGSRVELQEESPRMELREGSRVELQEESPRMELREGSRVELQKESPRMELREGSRVELREESTSIELREGSRVELQEESTRVELREGSPTVEDFNRSDYTPPPIDSQLTLKLAPEKYTTSADGKFKLPFGQHLLELFLKKVTIV